MRPGHIKQFIQGVVLFVDLRGDVLRPFRSANLLTTTFSIEVSQGRNSERENRRVINTSSIVLTHPGGKFSVGTAKLEGENRSMKGGLIRGTKKLGLVDSPKFENNKRVSTGRQLVDVAERIRKVIKMKTISVK